MDIWQFFTRVQNMLGIQGTQAIAGSLLLKKALLAKFSCSSNASIIILL
jgi:hypothetical protein